MAAYTLFVAQWRVVRNTDGKTVSPCADEHDPDFLDYLAWVEQGNEPDIDETPEEEI
jgi:hypothetical protein